MGATNINDGITPFSANGPQIDVSAPGDGVLSTNFNNGYIDLSGTSMATPHAAGLASLLKGFNTNLANDDIEQIIRLTADDRLPIGFDNAFGTGRINAQRALQALQAPNTLQQLSTTSGTIFSTSASMTKIFLGVPDLPDAAYVVKRSEVRKTVILPPMCNTIGVWGRGVGTTGYREENGRCFGEGICEVVPGTLTASGCTLRTWVYEVWAVNGQYLGFYPRAANNVVFQYTILGAPSSAPIGLTAEQLSCSEVQFNISGNTGNAYNWSVNSGDLLFNGTSTTAITTTPSIYTTGSAGSVSVTSTNACGILENVNLVYEPFTRGPLNIPNPMIHGDHLSVSVNTTPYDTYYRWYVNGSLVKEGQFATIYCTCYYEGQDLRQCGNNTVRVEVDNCGITSFYED